MNKHGSICYCFSFWSVIGFLPLHYLDDQINEGEVGGPCGTYGRGLKCIQWFGRKTCRKEITWNN
jgi:hypothetical protein